MFGIGLEKLFVLAVLGAVLVGPERLPKVADDAARFILKVRSLGKQAADELKDQLGPEFSNLNTNELNPRKFIANNLEEITKSTDSIQGDLKKITKSVQESKIDPDLL